MLEPLDMCELRGPLAAFAVRPMKRGTFSPTARVAENGRPIRLDAGRWTRMQAGPQIKSDPACLGGVVCTERRPGVDGGKCRKDAGRRGRRAVGGEQRAAEW
jgi:hypothetical protein